MKKVLYALFLGILLLTTNNLFAQQDAEAKKVLDAMSKTYQKINAYKAKVTYQLESQSDKSIDDAMEGEITVKGDKFHLKTAEQEIYNNSKTVWTYLKDENEVTITGNDEESEMNPTRVYKMYKEGFKYLLVGSETVDNVAYHVVDLVPEDKNLDYFKLRLLINKSTNTLGNWKFFQKNGMRFTFKIEKFEKDIKVADNFFAFDKNKYPNVLEVDLTEN
jgi:outer membrane lipoprotein-sorting protein